MENNVPENRIFRRLEDHLLLLGSSAIVKVVTCTYRSYSKNNEKYFYMKENKFTDGMKDEVYNIQRDIPVYLSINGLLNNYNNTKFNIRITGGDLTLIRKMYKTNIDKFISEIMSYNGTTYNDIDKIEKLNFPIYSSNSMIEFKFTYARLNSDDLSLAIQMAILNANNVNNNDIACSIFIPINHFLELIYILENIELHSYAANILNNVFDLKAAKLESEYRKPLFNKF